MTVGHKLLLVAEATVGFFDAFIPHCFQKFVIPAGQKPLRRRCCRLPVGRPKDSRFRSQMLRIHSLQHGTTPFWSLCSHVAIFDVSTLDCFTISRYAWSKSLNNSDPAPTAGSARPHGSTPHSPPQESNAPGSARSSTRTESTV